MFKTIVKIVNKDKTPEVVYSAPSVVLDALCAYRDQLIMSDEYDTPAVRAKLMILHVQIQDVWNQL
jgi:hypothetical protein